MLAIGNVGLAKKQVEAPLPMYGVMMACEYRHSHLHSAYNIICCTEQVELEGSSASHGGTYKGAFSDGKEGRSIESEQAPKKTDAGGKKGRKVTVAPATAK